jgi:hypothetical protein
MFIGHYSAAFVAATHPKAPGLGTLFVAAQLIDVAFFSFLPLGIEHMRVAPGMAAMNPMDLYDMPWTHSLIGAAGWAVAFGLLVAALTKRTVAGVLAGLVVVSHWPIDWLVHIPDLTIAGSPPKLGLGLWNHPVIAMPLELGVLAASVWFYASRTRATAKPWLLPALIVLLLVFQAVNWFGPPPVAVDARLWGMGLAAFALAALAAAWVARNRAVRVRS